MVSDENENDDENPAPKNDFWKAIALLDVRYWSFNNSSYIFTPPVPGTRSLIYHRQRRLTAFAVSGCNINTVEYSLRMTVNLIAIQQPHKKPGMSNTCLLAHKTANAVRSHKSVSYRSNVT